VVVVAAVAAGVVAWRSGASRSADGAGVSSGRGAAPASTTTTAPPPPLTVTSVTPANGATNVSGVTPVVVNFSAPLAPSSPMPVVSPTVPGSWQPAGPAALSFTPTVAFAPYSAVTVTVPGGAGGALAKDGARLASPFVDHVMIAAGSELRLQELLAGLAYLPLTWTPSGATPAATDAAGQATAAFNPPAGTFAWAQTTWPASLTSQWQAGAANLVTKGAVMAFEADHGLTVDGVAGSHVWAALLAAVPAGTANTGGYNYALGSKTHPQGLTIWHNGSEVFHSTANFGISVAPTADGTFPVYARLRNQVMRGNNPGGGTYADPVQYVAYFNGGDAVHYIARSNYGSPASLGCIELPLAQAAEAWPYLSLGTLVTVAG
jgi:peptidoglycan hydrolase-like protein with peptidoglycan-binding domain